MSKRMTTKAECQTITSRLAQLGSDGHVLYLAFHNNDNGAVAVRGFRVPPDAEGESDIVYFTDDEVLGLCAMAMRFLAATTDIAEVA